MFTPCDAAWNKLKTCPWITASKRGTSWPQPGSSMVQLRSLRPLAHDHQSPNQPTRARQQTPAVKVRTLPFAGRRKLWNRGGALRVGRAKLRNRGRALPSTIPFNVPLSTPSPKMPSLTSADRAPDPRFLRAVKKEAKLRASGSCTVHAWVSRPHHSSM